MNHLFAYNYSGDYIKHNEANLSMKKVINQGSIKRYPSDFQFRSKPFILHWIFLLEN